MPRKKKTTASQQRRGTGKNNNGNPAKLIGHSFKDHPERINRKGRPPLLIHQITASLKAEGIEKVTIGQVEDIYMTIMNCSEDKLKLLGADPKAPYVLRKLLLTMSSDRFLEVLDRIMDRSFGKAKQHLTITDAEAPEPDKVEPTHEQLLASVNKRLEEIDKQDEPPL